MVLLVFGWKDEKKILKLFMSRFALLGLNFSSFLDYVAEREAGKQRTAPTNVSRFSIPRLLKNQHV